MIHGNVAGVCVERNVVTPPNPSLCVVPSELIAIAARMAEPVDFIFVELWP
jgi:hypothetical protein